jgi:transcriptional regulator with XRE-family HTH domain
LADFKPIPTYQRWILRRALGDEILALRMEKGYKRRHWLARKIKASIPTIAALEKGRPTDKKRVTLGTLERLAEVFFSTLYIEINGRQTSISTTIPLEELITVGAQIAFISRR